MASVVELEALINLLIDQQNTNRVRHQSLKEDSIRISNDLDLLDVELRASDEQLENLGIQLEEARKKEQSPGVSRQNYNIRQPRNEPNYTWTSTQEGRFSRTQTDLEALFDFIKNNVPEESRVEALQDAFNWFYKLKEFDDGSAE